LAGVRVENSYPLSIADFGEALIVPAIEIQFGTLNLHREPTKIRCLDLGQTPFDRFEHFHAASHCELRVSATLGILPFPLTVLHLSPYYVRT